MNAHAPGATFDVPMGEFVNAASSIAVVVDHNVLSDSVDSFNDRGGAEQKRSFPALNWSAVYCCSALGSAPKCKPIPFLRATV